mgnify:CR=1 FL=1
MSQKTPKSPKDESPTTERLADEPRPVEATTVGDEPAWGEADADEAESGAAESGEQAADDRGGEIIAGYRLIRMLGRGGMGEVYEVRQELVGSRAAMKLLPPQLMSNPRYVERFEREAKAASRMTHAGLVKVFNYGQHTDGSPFILMEYVEGPGLRQVLQAAPDRRLPLSAVLRYGQQLAEAMASAHAALVVHCDLKPENIKLAPEPAVPGGERVRVLDFGIARWSDTGSVITLGTQGNAGTPAYMSPERCVGARHIDGKSDVYGLGCLLYEMLCGAPPFTGTAEDLLVLHRHSDPVPPSAHVANVPAELDALILRMLAKPADARPEMSQVAVDLARMASPGYRGSPAPRVRSAGRQRWLRLVLWAALPGLGAVGLGLWLGSYLRSRPAQMVRLAGGTWLQRLAPEAAAGSTPRMTYLDDFFLDANEVTCGEFIDWVNEGIRRHEITIDTVRHGEESTHFVVYRGRTIANLFEFESLSDHGCIGALDRNGQARILEGNRGRPIAAVSWFGASAYCAARGARLPTEAEWQYAASGRARFRYPWGDEAPRCDRVLFGRGLEKYQECLAPQAGTPATWQEGDRSRDGIYRLAGSMKEWVADCFQERYPDCPGICRNPLYDPPICDERVLRGGSWASPKEHLDAAHRGHQPPDVKPAYVSFRCARSAR